MHFMQEKITPKCTFLHRTDILAAAKGIHVQDLTDLLGLSRRTLFLCRADDAHVTKKTLMRLEAAEKAAGIGERVPQIVEPTSVNLTEVRLPQTVEGALPARITALESQVSELVAAMREQTEQIQKLLDQRATSSPDRGQGAGSKGKKLA